MRIPPLRWGLGAKAVAVLWLMVCTLSAGAFLLVWLSGVHPWAPPVVLMVVASVWLYWMMEQA